MKKKLFGILLLAVVCILVLGLVACSSLNEVLDSPQKQQNEEGTNEGSNNGANIYDPNANQQNGDPQNGNQQNGDQQNGDPQNGNQQNGNQQNPPINQGEDEPVLPAVEGSSIIRELVEDDTIDAATKATDIMLQTAYNLIDSDQYYYGAKIDVEAGNQYTFSDYNYTSNGVDSFKQSFAYTGSLNTFVFRCYYGDQRLTASGLCTYDFDEERWDYSLNRPTDSESTNRTKDDKTPYFYYGKLDFPLDFGGVRGRVETEGRTEAIDYTLIDPTSVKIEEKTIESGKAYYVLTFNAVLSKLNASEEMKYRLKNTAPDGMEDITFTSFTVTAEIWKDAGVFRFLGYETNVTATLGRETGDVTIKNEMYFHYDDSTCSVARRIMDYGEFYDALTSENKTKCDEEMDILEGKGQADPEEPSTISAEDQAKLDAALASLEGKHPADLSAADLDAIKEVIANLYNTANTNKIDKEKTGQAITILFADGGIDLMNVQGSMVVCGIQVQAGDQFYSQKATMLYNCSHHALQPALEGALNQQERAYADEKNGVYLLTGTLKGNDAKIESDEVIQVVPFIQIGTPDTVNSYNQADFYQNGYYLDDPREITNFRIVKENIVLDPAALNEGQSYIEYNAEEGYYICHFSLDCDDYDCAHVAREYLRNREKSADLQYWKVNVTLEVWENGYFKRMYDEEGWEGSTALPVLGNQTTRSESAYESVTYYAFDDELKKLFTEADQAKYAGDDWAAKIIADYAGDLCVTQDNVNGGTITVGFTFFEPYNYWDEDHELTGFDTELAEMVFADLGYAVDFLEIDWDEKYNLLNNNSIDCIWNGYEDYEDRKEQADTSYDYLFSAYVVVVRANERNLYTDFDTSFIGKVGCGDWIMEDDQYRNLFVGANIQTVLSDSEAIRSVINGAADFAFVNYCCALGAIDREDLDSVAFLMDLSVDDYYCAVAFKNGSDLTARVNTVLEKFAADGTLAQLAEKYGLERALITDFSSQR